MAEEPVVITDREHPWFGQSGCVLERDVPLSLSFLGCMDKLRLNNGFECFAKPEQYSSVRKPPARRGKK